MNHNPKTTWCWWCFRPFFNGKPVRRCRACGTVMHADCCAGPKGHRPACRNCGKAKLRRVWWPAKVRLNTGYRIAKPLLFSGAVKVRLRLKSRLK